MGKLAPQATLAAEDRNFYNEGAFDYGAIVRSAWHDLTNRSYLEGGSTITQQLVTISVLDKANRTPLRKLQEAILAQGMTQKYSKDQILEMYMNRVFYGHNAYGISAAAQIFFGVQPSQLTIGQAALLAAIINGPAEFDPVLNWPGARSRQLYVLQGMVATGSITPAQAQQAAAENVQAELKLGQAPTPNAGPAPLHELRVHPAGERVRRQLRAAGRPLCHHDPRSQPREPGRTRRCSEACRPCTAST